MKNVWPLLLVVVAVFVLNKSCSRLTQYAHSLSGTRVAESLPSNPVRQMQREPSDMMERERALPQPGGLSANAMLGGVRQGLQPKDER